MQDVAALVAIASAVIGIPVFWLYWRARSTAEVRRVVVQLRKLLQGAVAVGGYDKPRFLQAEAQEAEQKLDDLIGRVNDKRLRDACRRLIETYRQTWATSPPPVTPRMYVAGVPETPNPAQDLADREHSERKVREVEHAEDGLAIVGEVLTRVNKLERLLPGSRLTG